MFTAAISCNTVGVVLRIFLLVVLFRLHKIRESSGFLVACLQISELAFTGVTDPLHSQSLLASQLNLSIGGVDCDVLTFFHETFICTNLWLMASLAVNRFTAIIFPLQFNLFPKMNVAAVSVLVPWSIGLSLTLPPYLRSKTIVARACGMHASKRTIPKSTVIAGIYLPLLITGVLYGFLLVSFILARRATRSVAFEGNANPERRGLKKRYKLAKVLFFSFLWCSLCFLPLPALTAIFPGIWWRNMHVVMLTRTWMVFTYATQTVRASLTVMVR